MFKIFLFKKYVFIISVLQLGYCSVEKTTGLRELSEGVQSHGRRFILVSVSDLISGTLSFSSLPVFFLTELSRTPGMCGEGVSFSSQGCF